MRQSFLFVIALTAVLGCATTRGTGVPPDATALEHVLDEWAIAWSSSQVERLLPLFTDDVYYEDVTLGSVIKGKEALRNFAAATFGAFADLRFEAKSRFVAANRKWGSIEWVFTAGRQRTSPGFQRPISLSKFGVRQSWSFATDGSVGTPTIGTSRLI